MTEKFEFNDQLKRNLYIMMGCGVLGLLWAFFFDPSAHHSRLWSNLLINAYYFTGIGMFGMFLVSATQLAYGGWQVLLRRIWLSLPGFFLVSFPIVILIMIGAKMDWHNLYEHWMHPHAGDMVVGDKKGFLNFNFWAIRICVYFGLWIAFAHILPKFYGEKDLFNRENYKFSKILAALYIVTFATTESFVSWDLVMSIDPHWYSTLFGWYNFASYGCAGFAFSILLAIYLKSKGYLAQVNENHIHDLGKFLFGFSIFWTYLWFSQFMLQWYGNIPEDTKFWVKRFDVGYFKFTVFFSLVVNFLMPLLIILKRGAKRNFKTISFMAVVLIIGHYIDFFNYIFFEPNVNTALSHHEAHASAANTETVLYAEAAKAPIADATTTDAVKHEVRGHGTAAHGDAHGHDSAPVANFAVIGIAEILCLIGFCGAFLFMFFQRLTQYPLVKEDDPYLKESIKHNI